MNDPCGLFLGVINVGSIHIYIYKPRTERKPFLYVGTAMLSPTKCSSSYSKKISKAPLPSPSLEDYPTTLPSSTTPLFVQQSYSAHLTLFLFPPPLTNRPGFTT